MGSRRPFVLLASCFAVGAVVLGTWWSEWTLLAAAVCAATAAAWAATEPNESP